MFFAFLLPFASFVFFAVQSFYSIFHSFRCTIFDIRLFKTARFAQDAFPVISCQFSGFGLEFLTLYSHFALRLTPFSLFDVRYSAFRALRLFSFSIFDIRLFPFSRLTIS